MCMHTRNNMQILYKLWHVHTQCACVCVLQASIYIDVSRYVCVCVIIITPKEGIKWLGRREGSVRVCTVGVTRATNGAIF